MLSKQQQQNILATVPILRKGGVALTKYFYNRMFSNHPELKNLFNMGNQKNGTQPTALAMSVLAYAEHIADPSVLSHAVDTIGHKHASLNVTADQYAIVGENLLASIKEVLGEEVATPEIIDAWAAAYQQLADLMIGVENKMYEEKKALKGGWTGWRNFVVKYKVKESEEITSFYLYPEDGEAVSKHQPGQYLSLRLFIPELNITQPRQYSISSLPHNKYYQISVKREAAATDHPEGMVSNRLHQHIKEGDVVELASPSGNFTLKQRENPKVFLAGGVGITPLLSMLSTLINSNSTAPITWIQGFKSKRAQPFAVNLSKWEAEYEHLQVYTFYESKPEKSVLSEALMGRVDLDQIKGFEVNKNAEYYICGPTAFIEKQFNYLINKGVDSKQIAFEQFGPHTLDLSTTKEPIA